MSFILDALKKVDTQKKSANEAAAGEVARSAAARERRGRDMLLMAGIAFGSAVLTAAGLWFFTAPRSTPDPVEAKASGVDAAPPVAAEPVPIEPSPPPEAEVERAVEPRGPAREEASPAPTPVPVPVPVPAPAEREPEAAPEALGLDTVSPSPPVRIVGQGGGPPAEAEEEAELAPAALPDLVLQGTSVLDGRPVAVISDQRVFEGDFIEGARVVRILERSVELELDGRRFTLTF